MHALLRFEIAVGVVALDSERHALDSRFVACEEVEFSASPARAFNVSRVHTIKHRAPILRFRSACACMESEDCVQAVVLAAEQSGQRQTLDVFAEFVYACDEILVLFFILFKFDDINRVDHIVNAGNHLFELLEFALKLTYFF